MEDSKEASTQTESDLHDIFYYKSRAFKAEVRFHAYGSSLLSCRININTHILYLCIFLEKLSFTQYTVPTIVFSISGH